MISPYTDTNKRCYLWVPRSEIAFFQANLEAEDGLARIRTERHDKDRSLILIMYCSSRESEVFDYLRYLKTESGINWEFVDSSQQSPV